jgi:Zn-dependent alcohol dehydrogenase
VSGVTVRAAILREAPARLEVVDVHVSEPGSGEVLVRTIAAGLCGSDLHIVDGIVPWSLPAVLGHEAAGVVEALGEGVNHVSVGDQCRRVRVCVLRRVRGVPQRTSVPLSRPSRHTAQSHR